MKIIKRNGIEVPFDSSKITNAVKKAILEIEPDNDEKAENKAKIVTQMVMINLPEGEQPTVEIVQDLVENALMDLRMNDVAKAYVLYRYEHQKERSRKEKTMDFLHGKFMDITSKGIESEVNKGASGNANVDTESAMGKMLSYGAEFSKTMALDTLVSPEFAKAHKEGRIHIHDLDFLPTKTLTCCQIDLEKLFKKGFSTGHGFLREPQSIGSYASLAAIALQANQNDQHGGQSIPMFDYYMAPGVLKTFKKEFKKILTYGFEDLAGDDCDDIVKVAEEAISYLQTINIDPEEFAESFKKVTSGIDKNAVIRTVDKAYERAYKATEKATYQAMEGLVHNLNTMHSRAGAQVPFTSLNFGTDTSPEGRMVIKNFLLATEAGLGNGETPIFPISIFKLKEGVSYNPGDPNYDLFELACRVSAKRLFPNFSFLDSTFNKQYYKPGHPETEATYMGCVDGCEVITIKTKNGIECRPFSDVWEYMSTHYDVKKSGESEYIDMNNVQIYDSTSGFVNCYRLIKNPDKSNWMRIKAQNGRVLLLTEDHPLLTDRGRVNAKDIKLGDKIKITEKQPLSTKENYLSVKEAYLLGSVMCDGCYNRTLTLSVGPDEIELAKKFQNDIKDVYGLNSEIIFQKRGEKGEYIDVLVKGNKFGYRKEIADIFAKTFEGYSKINRRVPQKIFSATENAKLSFLAAVIDCDGGVRSDKKGVIVQTGFVNKEMSLQLAQLIRSLEYPTKVYINHYNSEDLNKERYRVEFRADERLFSYMVCDKKIKDLTYQSKARELEWAKITSIESLGYRNKPSFDVTTASDKFDVSGIVSHNCRTRVIGNVCGEETVTGRGNLSFTSINMPRLAIEAKEMYFDDRDESARINRFFELLEETMELCKNQLLERMTLQATATPRNFSFLMGEGVWRGSENLGPDDTVAEVIKQGTLSIGFIGLAETLTELIGEHHGESDRAQELGLKIAKRMRDYCDQQSRQYGLNITYLATPAEGLSGRFVRMDREKYGVIPGVTDKDYYTNSFHIPVGFNISAFEKINKEAPYHEFTNAGHISYIELDGDPTKNLDAFMAIVRAEHDAGMGYAAINHPVDRDPICGYTGLIDDECPGCGRHEHDGPHFERIRRITGYLVGTMDKWNDAKTAEEADRVKHSIGGSITHT